jgi:hypothetical protein
MFSSLALLGGIGWDLDGTQVGLRVLDLGG